MTTTVVFMGTPDAAVPSLASLDEIADVHLVVTRPDRPRGRSGRPEPPAVKRTAVERGLPLIQPETKEELARLVADRPGPDLGVVAAFGMILSPAVLAWPERGFLNVHFSLLPRWRGAAPVERAIMAGDARTGVTIMEMDEGLDTGPIVATASVDIGADETGGELTQRLAAVGAELLADCVPGWVEGELAARPQPDEGVTYADRITAEDRALTADLSVSAFVRRVRALAPSPGARLWIGGEPHKVLAAVPADMDAAPGTWLERDGAPVLGLVDGAAEITSIQPPGKRPMDGRAWLRGRPLPASIDEGA